MGDCLSLVTPLHGATKRDYVARVLDDKVHCMQEARKYGEAYWDGDRRYGYGGYTYLAGYWKPVALQLIERYDLKSGDNVIDLGCGKGFLLYEMQLLLPGLELVGMDFSKHAIKNRHPEFKGLIFEGDLRYPLGIKDKGFDLAISLMCVHNLRLRELSRALPEIERIGKRAYVLTESFRTETEWFNLVAWCLTAETILRPEDWEFLFSTHGYRGDYEFLFFE